MLSRLTERAKSAILNASSAKDRTRPSVKDMLGSLKKSGGVGTYLIQNNPSLKISNGKVNLDSLVEKAFYHSASFQHRYVGTEHLLLALLDISESPDAEEIKKQISALNTFPNMANLSDNLSKTPFLDSFGENLNKTLSHFALSRPVHRKEVDSLTAILLQKENANPLIVGEVGVGKHSLVELLVHQINSLEVPVALTGFQIVELDVMAFIANLSGREGVETGIANLLEELDNIGDVILYIKDFQNLFIGTNNGFAVPLAFSLLRSYLHSSGVSVIGAVSTPFHNRLISENAQILNNFEEVILEEPSEDKIKEIMKLKAKELSRYHNVKIASEVVDYSIKTAKSNIKGQKFPLKSVTLIDQACTKVLLKEDGVPAKYKALIEKKADLVLKISELLELGEISTAVSLRTKLQKVETKLETMRHTLLMNSEMVLTKFEVDTALEDMGVSNIEDGEVDLESLSKLAQRIKEKIIGQDSAVDTVSKALVRAKLGLRPKKRPIGNFLLLGPTGVGKTELGKILAETAFGEDSLIRLDMSDFGEKHTVARLVGAPPGYIGYGDGGELTSKIENKPESVVLFDEIEKAHPDVLNILLQIMEEGELVDAKGQTFDFSQAVIVLTSNLGTEIVFKDGIGFSGGPKTDEQVENRLVENLKKIMKPELINRFDEVVVFKRLNKDNQMKILNLLLDEISTTLKEQDIKLKIYSDVKDELLTKGYSDEYGARELRRAVETKLLDKVAEFLLKNPQRPLKLKAKLKGRTLIITL